MGQFSSRSHYADTFSLNVQQQTKKVAKSTEDNYKDFPFWCGYLPDNDTKDLLNNRNDFLLRKLESEDVICLTVCFKKNSIFDIAVVEEDTGWRLQGQKLLRLTIKDLIEFYWCTKWSILFRGRKFRLEVPILRPDWLLTSMDIKFGEILGEGAFGIVVLGELADVADRMKCAVKQLQEDVPDEELNTLWKEARIMRGMRNKNIVAFYGIVNDERPFSLVIEYINGTSVDNFLKKSGQNSDIKFRIKILIDAARGMKYLHSQRPPFLHLDLASRNLLMHWEGILKRQSNVTTKVADFGLSKRAQKEYIDTQKPLNLRWIDPHSYTTGEVDPLTDIWAFAVTIFECFVRPFQIPYSTWPPERVRDEILEAPRGKRKRLDRPNGMPISIYELMKSCMLLDEKRCRRQTFDQLQVALEREYNKH